MNVFVRVAVLGFAALCVSSAHAFVVLSLDDGRSVVRWASGNLSFEVNAELIPGLEGDVEAVVSAMESWNAVSCAQMNGSYRGETTALGAAYPIASFDGVNRVIYVAAQNWRPEDRDALAITVLNFELSGRAPRISEADIAFHGAVSWSTAATAQAFDVESVASHEIGHLWGLQHSPLSDAVMYFATPPGTTANRTLHPDDEAGACYLYPSNAGACEVDAECPRIESLDGLGNRVDLGQMRCESGQCEVVPAGEERGFGEGCEESSQCQAALFCSRSGETGLCTRACELSGTDCPTGYVCAPRSFVDQEGVCLPEGEGSLELGEACDFSTECVDGLCVSIPGGDTSRGVCSKPCDTTVVDCPGGTICVPLAGQQVRGCFATGTGQPGDTCDSFVDCEDGRCLADRDGALCRRACETRDVESGCAAGTSCLSTVFGDACFREGEGSVGAACREPFDCKSLTCLPLGEGGSALCTERCDSDAVCGELQCVFFGVGESFCAPGAVEVDVGKDTAEASPDTVSVEMAEPESDSPESCGCQTLNRSSERAWEWMAWLVVGVVFLRRSFW